MEPSRHTSVLQFGTYEIALQSGELRKAGVRIKVQQQPLKLLEILLEHPGEVVTRAQLRSRIWPNESFGDFDQAVNVAIAKLRGALGDSADNPRYIETLPRRGYRFIAHVAVVNQPANKPELLGEVATPQVAERDQPEEAGWMQRPRRLPLRYAWKMLGTAMVLVLLILVVWIFFWRSRQRANTLSLPPVRSLAVLPLENLSSDSQDYFADGMTDELITNLAQISALRVISRTSVMPYKGVRKPLPLIARELNVDAVVEGTVLRSGQQVRITAQLIRAPADKHLWAESYEGDLRDTLALQKKVARAIAEQIRIQLTPQEETVLHNVNAVNPEAYEDYLKGRYFWNKRTADGMKRAIDYFDQAIESDPNYAHPMPAWPISTNYLTVRSLLGKKFKRHSILTISWSKPITLEPTFFICLIGIGKGRKRSSSVPWSLIITMPRPTIGIPCILRWKAARKRRWSRRRRHMNWIHSRPLRVPTSPRSSRKQVKMIEQSSRLRRR